MINSNLKELLTRYAVGLIDFIPEDVIDPEIEAIINNVHLLRKELNRVDILSALIRLYPESVFPSVDDTTDNDALVYIVKNQNTKQKLIKFDAEISEALLRKQDDPTYDWNNLVEKLTQIFHSTKSDTKYTTLDSVSFEESKVVASFGIPELDKYCGGGIGVGSITVFYSAVNCLSQDTEVYVGITKDISLRDTTGGFLWQNETKYNLKKLYQRFHKLGTGGLGGYQRKSTINSKFYIQSMSEEHNRIYYNEIKDVVFSGNKEVYLVKLANGKTIKSTLDHEFYTGKDYTKLANLKVGDSLFIKSGHKSIKPKTKRPDGICVKYHPNGNLKFVNGCKYFRVLPNILAYEAYLNDMTMLEYRNLLNNFDGRQLNLVDSKVYAIHHIDENPYNNDISNLKMITHEDHWSIHKDQRTWQTKKSVEMSNIVSIDYIGLEECYDIIVADPDRNFIANDIVVHNCGKTTLVTRNLSARLLEQGKRPLIISLEGDTNKLAIKIIAQLLGFGKTDIKDFSDYQKDQVLKKSKEMPSLPIVNCKASKKWELQKLVRTYEPDVIIYDQLTIGAGGRDWQEMAKLSNTLRTLASETGIPVVAITQSTEKNYHGADKKKGSDDEDESTGVGQIKYGQSILEDADNVINIKKVFDEPTHRTLTIVKTRDDSAGGLLPISFDIEYTDKGVVPVKPEVKITISPKQTPKTQTEVDL